MVPIVASVNELPDAIKYAEDRPNCRWFVAKRAVALGEAGQVPAHWGEAITAATTPNTAQRDALAKRGLALPDGSFPITNRTDLAKAVRAVGRAKNRAAAKRHIVKRARALHSTDLLPDSYKPLTSATVTPDESGLWVAQVRELLSQAGLDPDAVEAGTDGFAADYTEYADKPDVYVRELIAADTDEEADDENAEDDQVTEPEPEPSDPGTAAPVQLAPVSASVDGQFTHTVSTGSPYVAVYTASPASPPTPPVVDIDALLAAVKATVRDEMAALVAAKVAPVAVPDDDKPDVTVPPVTPDATDATTAPVDVESAKSALRDRFNSTPKTKKAKAPVKAVPMAASVTAMRERIAARTTS